MVPSFINSLQPDITSGFNDEEVLLLLEEAEKNGICKIVEDILGGIKLVIMLCNIVITEFPEEFSSCHRSLWSRLDEASLCKVPMSTMRKMIRDVTATDLDVVLVAIECCRINSCKVMSTDQDVILMLLMRKGL